MNCRDNHHRSNEITICRMCNVQIESQNHTINCKQLFPSDATISLQTYMSSSFEVDLEQLQEIERRYKHFQAQCKNWRIMHGFGFGIGLVDGYIWCWGCTVSVSAGFDVHLEFGISSARWKSRLSRHTRDTSLPAAFDLIPRDARAAPYLFPRHVGSPLLLALPVASVSRCSLPPSPWVTLPNYWPVRPLNYWIPTDTSVWIQFCFRSQIIPN